MKFIYNIKHYLNRFFYFYYNIARLKTGYIIPNKLFLVFIFIPELELEISKFIKLFKLKSQRIKTTETNSVFKLFINNFYNIIL